MKSLDDIKIDMSVLYDEVASGSTELKTAAELANIAGKYLNAEQLQLAREIFMGQLGKEDRWSATAGASVNTFGIRRAMIQRYDIRLRALMRWLPGVDSWASFADRVIVIACCVLVACYAFGWPH